MIDKELELADPQDIEANRRLRAWEGQFKKLPLIKDGRRKKFIEGLLISNLLNIVGSFTDEVREIVMAEIKRLNPTLYEYFREELSKNEL